MCLGRRSRNRISSPLKSVARLLSVHAATWEDYWGRNDFVAEKLKCLRLSWDAYIASSYSEGQRPPFVRAYFDLLHVCLAACEAGIADLALLKKVIGFETFAISGTGKALAAGVFNIRNPAYLLSRVAQPTAPHDPKFLPLILPYATDAGILQPFFHYRRIGIIGKYPAQLFIYPSTDSDCRAGSFWLVAELFAALTSRTDPWVRERTRLLFDGAFGYLVATLGLERV